MSFGDRWGLRLCEDPDLRTESTKSSILEILVFFCEGGALEGCGVSGRERSSSEPRSAAEEDEDGAAWCELVCRVRRGRFDNLPREMKGCREAEVDGQDG